jgi:hypothetical protein
VAPEEIGGRWAQFHDCYFPQLPTKYVPQEVSLEKTISWVFFTEKLPFDRYGMFLRSFLRRKHLFGYWFSETNIL